MHYKSIMALVGRVYESPELVTMVQRCSDVTAAGSYDFDDVIDGGESATSLLFDFLEAAAAGQPRRGHVAVDGCRHSR